MRYQPIYDIPELCARKGLSQVVLCPGSRCAPLTLAFSRHPGLTVRTFSDERSAAFVALGLAQQTGKPTILVCTSGSAVYNFAPAIAEAYFNNVPLLVLTADRPSEWIGQQDGQTIYQADIFKAHVKKSFQLPQEYDHADSKWAINRILNDAINLSLQELPGPVHINAPFREPLYPTADEVTAPGKNIRIIEDVIPVNHLSPALKESIIQEWSSYINILIVAGQTEMSSELLQALKTFSATHAITIAGDITSNLHQLESAVKHADVFLGQASDDVKKSLRPDLLITFGKSLVSKNLKQFLRKYSPKAHWHIQAGGAVADPFQHLTRVIHTHPALFFDLLNSHQRPESFEGQKQRNYFKLWEIEERRTIRGLQSFFPPKDFGEFEVVKEILKELPAGSNLHLANSMSVRYANFIGLTTSNGATNVWCNRGTSGIDGCTSTAVGHSLANKDVLNVLITGDLAFFYDRNAFWHNYPMHNLRVVLLNNHGGVIFKMIDGPGDLPEADDYFVTTQRLSARRLCEEFGFELLRLDSRRKVKNLTQDFFEAGKTPKILEVETTALASKTIFDNFKKHIKKTYEL